MSKKQSEVKVEIQEDRSSKPYNLNAKFLFKVIRNDDHDFWDSFCDGLTSTPEAPRPPLRHAKPIVGRYGIRIDGVYAVKKEPLFVDKPKKWFHSKHQSCSVACPERYFRPVVFGHASNRQECLVGIRLDSEDSDAVLVQRAMAYDRGTVNAGYRRFSSWERAQHEYFELKLSNKVFNTLDDLIAKGDPKEVNEVMARLRWVCKPSSQICIFSDTLEARLLAQVRAKDLYNHLKDEKVEMPKGYEIPISFYLPAGEHPCRMYERKEQEADRRKALQSEWRLTPLQPHEEKLKSRERVLALMLKDFDLLDEEDVLENLEGLLEVAGKLTGSTSHAFFEKVLMRIKFDKFPIKEADFWAKIFKIIRYENSADYLQLFRKKFSEFVSEIESGYVSAEMDVVHISPGRAPAILELLEKKEIVVPDLTVRFLFAAKAGALHLVKLIIASKKLRTVNIKIVGKTTVLIEAIIKGHADIVAELIKAGVSIRPEDNCERNPLLWAASKGHIGILDLLIEAKADVHACDKNGDTALIWAVKEGHIDIVRYLISKKVGVHAKNKEGETALTLARKLGSDAEIAQMLRALGMDQEEKKEINLPQDEDSVSLERKNKIKKIKKLFLAGEIDPYKPLHSGEWSPIFMAVYYGDLDLVKLFLENGGKFDQNEYMGFSLLQAAAQKEHLDIVRLLLEHGAEPNRANHNGKTALFFAVGKGNLSIVKLLLENRANPNIMTKDATSFPFQVAVQGGHLSIAKLLLEHGANPSVDCRGCDSLLEIANLVKRQKEIVGLLFRNIIAHAAEDKGVNARLTIKIELLVHLLEEDKESKNIEKVTSILKKLRGVMSMINNQDDTIIESKVGGRQSPYFRDPKKNIPVGLAKTLDRIAEMVAIVEKGFVKGEITDEMGILLQEKLKSIVNFMKEKPDEPAKKSSLLGSLLMSVVKKSDMNLEEIYQNISQFLVKS